MFFIVEREFVTVRRYLVEAKDLESLHEEGDTNESEELLGAIDEDESMVSKITGFATKEEALASEDASVEWKA